MNSTNIMEPLIIESDMGASVKTIHNQLLSYDLIYRKCTYPFHIIFEIKNGEYITINISNTIYHKIVKKEAPVLINSTEDINLLKYIINKLY